jgi:hypothetical protein
MRILAALLFASLCLQQAHAQAADAQGRQPPQPPGVYLQTAAQLDEPRGFCFDLSGFPVPSFDTPVQGHTCKESYDHRDQLYEEAAAKNGQLKLPAYSRCLAAEGDKLFARPCAASPAQKWLISTGGALRPSPDPTLCVTIGTESTLAGHPEEVRPSWLHRTISLAKCDWKIGPRQMWRLKAPEAPMHVGPEQPARN